MTETGTYLTATITILGVAYPILLQVIARLDEKYSSDHIVELFNLEWELKAFKGSLICTLILIVLWSLKIPPIFDAGVLEAYINNSAAILIAISSIALIVMFFFLVEKILIYYTPSRIIKYLIEKHNNPENNFKYFEALTDILLLSIKRQERNHTKTLSSFYYSAFKNEREKSRGNPVEYPDLYYDAIYKIVEELGISKEKRNRAFEVRAGGGSWLLGEVSGYQISEKTYIWLWRNLLLMVENNSQDMIFDYWKTAFQYVTYILRPIYSEISYSEGVHSIVNQEEIDNRKIERNRFEEFHFAMGGLLLYSDKHELLPKMFSYTQSQPPDYKMFPRSMTEIFTAFNKFWDPYDNNFSWISSKYSFLGLGGIGADSIVKSWISKYIAILFLRQYKLLSNWGAVNPLALPILPKEQSKIREWIDGMDYFKSLVQEILEDEVLSKTLGFDSITRSWSEEEKIRLPLDYIDDLKKKFDEAYVQNSYTREIDNAKVYQFELATQNVLLPVINEVFVLNNSNKLGDEVDKWYIHGKRMLFSKDAFSESPEVHHMEFDSFFAERVAEVIREGLASTFLFKKSKGYLLKAQDIFEGIKKLNVNNDYIIINYGLDIQSYIDKQTKGLSLKEFEGVQIVEVTEAMNVRNSLFILKKSDLPSLKLIDTEEDKINRFLLKKISKDFNLYASVIDLNKANISLLDEIRGSEKDEELRKLVLLFISFLIEIQWRKELNLIQIVESSPYRQKGIPNSLDDITSLK